MISQVVDTNGDAVPSKGDTILMGRYESPDEAVQILQPTVVVEELLGTVFTVQNFVVAGMVLVGLAALQPSVTLDAAVGREVEVEVSQ